MDESENDLVNKLLAMNAGVPIKNIETSNFEDEEWEKIIDKASNFKNVKLQLK